MRIPHPLWKWIKAFQYPLKPKSFLGLTGAFIYFCVQKLDVNVFWFSSIVRIYIRMLYFEAIDIFLILWLSLGMCGPETRSVGSEAHCLKYCSFLEDLFSLYVLLKRYIPQMTPSLTARRPSFVIQEETAISCLRMFSFKDSILIIKVANGLGLNYLKGG